MAKLTTRTAKEVQRLTAARPMGGSYVVVIRSDGAVLRKVAGVSYQDTFTRWAGAELVVKRAANREAGIKAISAKLVQMGYARI